MSGVGFRAWGLFALGIVLLAWPVSLSAGMPEWLSFVDDDGTALQETTEVCWVFDFERQCVEADGRVPVAIPDRFRSVEVEGPSYGPVRVGSKDLLKAEEERAVLVVPRKATMVLKGSSSSWPKKLSVSLYPNDSAEFRQPHWKRAVERRVVRGSGLKVPAGQYVLSISARGHAPDLHALEVSPGGAFEVEYHPRPGFSMLFRTVSGSTGEPLLDAEIELSAVPGYGALPAEGIRLETGSGGLAVVTGLTVPLVRAVIEHPDFVRGELPAVAATPGSFGFEEIRLPVGVTVRVRVTEAGEPVTGAACQLLVPFRPQNASEKDTGPRHSLGRTDTDGRCAGTRLPEGAYILEVRPSETLHHAVWARHLQLLDGEMAEVEASLRPIRVSGEVLRGIRAAEGYRVRFQRDGPRRISSAPVLIEARTDEEGRFEVVLWQEGSYTVIVRDPAGTVADHRKVVLTFEEETLDFSLAPGDIEGVVVDDQGEPVPEASVALRWPVEGGRSYRLSSSGISGEFSFSVDDRAGPARLTARKEGYEETTTSIEVERGQTPEPVTLVLSRRAVLAGQLVEAEGAPVQGAWVATSMILPHGVASLLGTALTDASGRFELPRAASGMDQTLFAAGPGCPLTAVRVSPNLPTDPLQIRCSPAPASILLQLRDHEGAPLVGRSLLLHRDHSIIPPTVLHLHQAALGLAGTTDGSGRLTLTALAPGSYDLYLSGFTNSEAILLGSTAGHLGSVELDPLQVAEIEIVLETLDEANLSEGPLP